MQDKHEEMTKVDRPDNQFRIDKNSNIRVYFLFLDALALTKIWVSSDSVIVEGTGSELRIRLELAAKLGSSRWVLNVGTAEEDTVIVKGEFRGMAGDYASRRVLSAGRNVLPLFLSKPLPRSGTGRVFSPSNAESDHPDSFFKSMRFVVEMAQIFSVLPVTGYRGPNYKSLQFRWIHWKTAYFALYVAGSGFILACIAWRNLSHGLTYDTSGDLVFFISSLAASVFLLQMATSWKQMNTDFAEMEFKMYKYGYPIGIAKKFKVVACAFMFIALVEHALSKMVQIQQILPCARDNRFTTITETFVANYYNEVFSYIPFNMWLGVLLVVIQLMCTFTWNFSDLLLGLISWSISIRFRRFNDSLFKIQGQGKDNAFWRMTRMDYNQLTDLTRKIDNHVQKLMLLSLGDNLYLICIQLLKGLQKSVNIYESIYFFWSVGFIIFRTCFVAFTAAAINDESKEAKTILYSVPESGYCAETRRFLTQLATNDVALTGCKFFSITRGLILTIAGTIITYEVILVQFNSGNDSSTGSRNKTHCFIF